MSAKARRVHPVQVYLDLEEITLLDSVAEDRRTSRSATARGLLHPVLIEEAHRLAYEAPPISDIAAATIAATGIGSHIPRDAA